MTRINIGVNPLYLTDEHLLAEHREIKRLPYVYQKSIQSGSINKIPPTFRLGKGHVLYFINKPNYTYGRYMAIHKECINRGFEVSDYSSNWLIYPEESFIDHIKESPKDTLEICNRIIERIQKSSKSSFHYKKQSISKEVAINLLMKDFRRIRQRGIKIDYQKNQKALFG